MTEAYVFTHSLIYSLIYFASFDAESGKEFMSVKVWPVLQEHVAK